MDQADCDSFARAMAINGAADERHARERLESEVAQLSRRLEILKASTARPTPTREQVEHDQLVAVAELALAVRKGYRAWRACLKAGDVDGTRSAAATLEFAEAKLDAALHRVFGGGL